MTNDRSLLALTASLFALCSSPSALPLRALHLAPCAQACLSPPPVLLSCHLVSTERPEFFAYTAPASIAAPGAARGFSPETNNPQPIATPQDAAFRRILGVRFYTGDLPGLIELTRQGGLITVPSAPVLVDLQTDIVHREAVESCDFAVTDSGFMVWLWFLRTGERLHRISGLKYLRALLEDPDFCSEQALPPPRAKSEEQSAQSPDVRRLTSVVSPPPSASPPSALDRESPLALTPSRFAQKTASAAQPPAPTTLNFQPITQNVASATQSDSASVPITPNVQPITKVACATFWIMPSARDAEANVAWLKTQGLEVNGDDCYVAPHYPRGPLADPALLDAVLRRRPRYIVICLGGGVQERLGYYLREALANGGKTRGGRGEASEPFPPGPAHGAAGSASAPITPNPHPITAAQPPPQPSASPLALSSSRYAAPLAPYRPAIICTGAAIAFLSGRQVNIPPWADRYVLGWLFRCAKEPRKFIPRYRKALRLIPLLFRFRDRSVAGGVPSAKG